MKRLRSFLAHYADARRYGFPLLWTIRAAWLWSAAPTPAALEMRAAYEIVRARRAQRMEAKKNLTLHDAPKGHGVPVRKPKG